MIIINNIRLFHQSSREGGVVVSPTELSQLTEPLIERASLPYLFRDRAAAFVLSKLGLDNAVVSSKRPSKLQRWQISRWIDNRVEAFFEKFPTGQGIEIGGGLSTRFHRLSDRAEWPRFQWLALNQADVDDCLKYVFPPTDNYRSVASGSPLQCWDVYANWRGTPPTIVLAGEYTPLSRQQDIIALWLGVEKALAQGIGQIDVVLHHRVNLLSSLAEFGPEAQYQIKNGIKLSQRGLLSRLNIFARLASSSKPASEVTHISFSREQGASDEI